jgi:hypothetical protein
MLKHYSHIRTEAKRRAVEALQSKPRMNENPSELGKSDSSSGTVPQDLLQVVRVN